MHRYGLIYFVLQFRSSIDDLDVRKFLFNSNKYLKCGLSDGFNWRKLDRAMKYRLSGGGNYFQGGSIKCLIFLYNLYPLTR